MMRAIIPFLLSLFLCTPAIAQTSSSGATIIPVDPAQLYRVEDGLFQMQAGQSVELTEQYLIMTFEYNPKTKEAQCVFNGKSSRCRRGSTHDFKTRPTWYGAPSGAFDHTERCFLTVTGVVANKGAPAIGVFRLRCV